MSKSPEQTGGIPNTTFDLARCIGERIREIPLPEPVVDPYERRSRYTTPVLSVSDLSFNSRTGRMNFAGNFDERRLMAAGLEVIYAYHRTQPNRSEAVINTFAAEGGLQQRTRFTPDLEVKGAVRKSIQTPPWDILSSGPFSSRILAEGELPMLEDALRNPGENLGRIAMATEEELELLETCRLEHQVREARFREDLKAIDKSRAAAWEHADDYLIR